MEEKFALENLLSSSEISLDDILSAARQMAEQVDFEIEIEKMVEEEEPVEVPRFSLDGYSPIVKGVARKYAVQNFGVERDDLEQDLWLKVCELTEGGSKEVEKSLVAKCLWNTAVDKYRYHRRRQDSKAAYTEATEEDLEAKLHTGSDFTTGVENLVLREIVEMFPENSKERKFLVARLYMTGQIDSSLWSGGKIEVPDGETDVDMSLFLGWSCKSGSLRTVKANVKKKVFEYLDIVSKVETEEDRVKAIERRATNLVLDRRASSIPFSEVLKDDALQMLSCSKEDLLVAFSSNSRVEVRVRKGDGKFFLVKKSRGEEF